MTKRDFFITILKVFGLYSLVISVYYSLTANWVNSLQALFASPNLDLEGSTYVFEMVATTTVIMIIEATLFWLLTFRADWVVDRLKLVKGLSDERIEFGGLTAVQIAKAGIFLIGVFVIVESVPQFLNLAYWSVRGGISGMFMAGEDNTQLVVKALEILFGWLLATNFDWLAQRISPKSQEQTPV